MINAEYQFNGWVMFGRGKAHALYFDPNDKEDPLAFLCGGSIYDLFVDELPKTTGMDIAFCSNCLRISQYRKDNRDSS